MRKSFAGFFKSPFLFLYFCLLAVNRFMQEIFIPGFARILADQRGALSPNLDVAVVQPSTTANSLLTQVDTQVNLPLGFDLDDVTLELTGGLTMAMLNTIQLQANQNTFQKYFNAADLDLINQYLDLPASNAIGAHIAAHFRFNRITQFGGREIFAPGNGKAAAVLTPGAIRNLQAHTKLRTGNYDSAGVGISNPQILLGFNGTPAVGALQVFPYARGNATKTGRGQGMCRTVQCFQVNAAAGQTVTLNQQNGLTLGSDQAQEIDRIYLIDPNSSISNILVQVGNLNLRNRPVWLNQWYAKVTPYRVTEATLYAIDFTDRAYGDENLVGGLLKGIQISFVVGTAGTISVYQDSVGDPLKPAAITKG
jgi:hypothetical protein